MTKRESQTIERERRRAKLAAIERGISQALRKGYKRPADIALFVQVEIDRDDRAARERKET